MKSSNTITAICFIPPAISVIAEKRGLLAARGVEAKSVLTTSSDEQFQSLVERRCDVAVTAMDNVIGWNRRDGVSDFRIIAQIETTTPLSLIVQPNIESIEMLVGRNILVDSTENGFVVSLRAMLADAGVDYQANRITPAGGVRERFESLRAGNGDAALLGPPFDGLAIAAGLRRLASANDLYPSFPGQGVVTRLSTTLNKEGLMRRWLRGLDEGRMQCRANPASAEADLILAGIAPLGAHALITGVGETLVPDRGGVALLISQRAQLGLPGAQLVYADLVDTRFLN